MVYRGTYAPGGKDGLQGNSCTRGVKMVYRGTHTTGGKDGLQPITALEILINIKIFFLLYLLLL